MKPPWLGPSQETAELEALQTDVMRFVAILGLCLAAIFSLVHSAAREHSVAESAPVELQSMPIESKDARPETPGKKHRPARSVPEPPAPEPAPTPVPESSRPGFTLEFGSASALRSLVSVGQVQLYALFQDEFWEMDAAGQFLKTAAPGSYYAMQVETVPRDFQALLTAADPGGEPTWAVTLPATITRQIQQLTDTRGGGNLVIGGDGSVTLDTTPASVFHRQETER